jgi:hypothetical protein
VKNKKWIGVWPIVVFFGVTICASALAASAEKSANREVPKFNVDPSWPTIPSGWKLGQVASTAADSDNNIWILHRPRTVKPGMPTGPPVMEFAPDGHYIRGWGGPGEGYDWPQIEHGIFVDYKGYVWICGNGPQDQVLKFTPDGKFVMQIGHGGIRRRIKTSPTSPCPPIFSSMRRRTNSSLGTDTETNG